MTEYFETSSKIVRRGRGMAQKSLDLIEAMYAAAEAAQPITGRGIGYKLFTRGLIPSMGRADMQRVYRLLKEARERGDIPWEWIVDETRAIERVSTWDDPADYASCVARSYRRDFWDQQPHRVEVWSEKGTVRGVLAPVLDQYAVGFLAGAWLQQRHQQSTTLPRTTTVADLIMLYVGDFDPSGMFMSEEDLPAPLRQVRRRSHQAEAHRAHATASARTFHHSPQRIRARTPATRGSSRITESVAGNLMRWTRTISAPASRGRSKN